MNKSASKNNDDGVRIRLQKFIADAGHCSRRRAEQLIVQNQVKVNGVVANILGTKVDPEKDVVEVEGAVLDLKNVEKVYLVLHKPRGCVTTVSDPEDRPTVMDYIKEVSNRVYPVGRLDYLSEGLLILTNDGEVANTLMHPKFEIIKVYEVKVFGLLSESLLRQLRNGVQLEDGFAKPLSVRVLKELDEKTWLEFRIAEGRNREIRRICEAVGLTVDKLKRVAIGGLSITGIAPGNFHYFSRSQLLRQIGIKDDGQQSNVISDFVSPKKSAKIKKRFYRNEEDAPLMANSEVFKKFRKENYFKTIEETKLRKAETGEGEQDEQAEQAARPNQARPAKSAKPIAKSPTPTARNGREDRPTRSQGKGDQKRKPSRNRDKFSEDRAPKRPERSRFGKPKSSSADARKIKRNPLRKTFKKKTAR